jgi:hypothetical protein
MTGWDDLPDEMRGERIDEGTLDRLLRGHVPPDDAPPGYSDVASVLLAVASQPTREELSMQAQHVLAAQDAIKRRTHHRRPGPLGLAAGAIVVALLILPGLAVANVLHAPSQAPTSTVPSVTAVSPSSAGGPSSRGASADHPASTGSEISTIATTTDATGVAKGAEISSIASGGKSQAGQHGKPADANPPVGTPNTGGTGTGDTASGGHAATGASAADGHSAGHSAAGSGNAA